MYLTDLFFFETLKSESGSIYLQTTSELRGELMVSLCYNNHVERLTVGIYEGRSFGSDGSALVGKMPSCVRAIVT